MIEHAQGISDFLQVLREKDLSDKVAQIEIDGVTYTSTKLLASRGLSLLPRLVNLFGPILDGILVGKGENAFDPRVLLLVAARAAEDDSLPKLCKDLLADMSASEVAGLKGGGKVVQHFDMHFAGDYVHLVKVVLFALMHSFKAPTRGAS